MKTVVLGITSGIAAFKVLDLIKKLKKTYRVEVIMSESATHMIPVADVEKLTKRSVHTTLYPKDFSYKKVLKERKVDHIALADSADLFIVAPATANIIAKVANGIADDYLSTTLLATKAPVLYCPSMNCNMWENKKTQRNINTLRSDGAFFVEPDSGDLACGYIGVGRLAKINRIESEATKILEHGSQLSGKTVLVTAGGTEERIDDVRVITNRSSGKMGVAIADECVKRGAKVILIRARTEIDPYVKLKDIRVHSSKDMLNAIKKVAKKCDIMFHAAAVSDFSVQNKAAGKISSKSDLQLELTKQTKIFDHIKEFNKNIFLIGFKAEHHDTPLVLKKKAIDTLRRANADLIIANDIGKNDFGSDQNEVLLIDSKGKTQKIVKADKKMIAQKILDKLVKIW